MTNRQAQREFWDSLEPYWQDGNPTWDAYKFPNGRRLLLEGLPSGQTLVTYDGAAGETTVTVEHADQRQFVSDVMAMPAVAQ